MTAIGLYREDRKNRKNPEARLPRQEYFAQLRDALHDELMREGRSDFLDEMLAECSGGKALPMLEFAALRECCEMIVENRPMQDASEYVPHVYRTAEERFAWRDLGQAAYRVDNPEFHEELSRLRTVSRQLVSVRDQTVAPDADSAVMREMSSVMTLNRALERDNAQLRQERDELRARLAELESGYISKQVQMRLEVRCRQEEARAMQELQARREAAEQAMLQRMTNAAQARMDSLRAGNAADAQAAQRADEHAQLREELQRCTDALRNQLDQQLQRFQTGLFAADHRFLAKSCAELFASAENGFARLLAMAQLSGADEALQVELAGFEADMTGQLTQLERALAQLGLQLLRPRPGEAFDPALHSPASARAGDAPAAEAVVEALVTPGVRQLGRSGEPGETLLRAVVRTGRRNDT